MRFGVHVPQWGAGAHRDGVIDVARCAEDVGLDSVWVADHLTMPLTEGGSYPYSRSGRTPFAPEDGFLEALTVLAVVAGATRRVQLGTSVLVAPQRHPLVTAKTVATLDVLSEGRVVLGVGGGWWREEFDALGMPFDRRGRAFDEVIEILRLLWEQGEGAYEGQVFRFGRVACLPRPVQPGGPPLLVGGTSRAALERAGRMGDGWHAVGASLPDLAAGIDTVRGAAVAAGRDPDDLGFSLLMRLPTGPDAVERLLELRALGIGHVVFGLPADEPKEACNQLEEFAGTTLRHIRTM